MSLFASSSARRQRSARLHLEPLEDRCLLAGINGLLFNDLNGDGVRAPGETPLVGRTVFLDSNSNGKLNPGERSTTTAADGSFSFANTGPGTFSVCQVIPNGWHPSTVTASAGNSPSPADKLIRLDQMRIDPRFAEIDGRGFSVAVIDTGVDAAHPWLKGTVIAQQDFTADGTVDDTSGHGTLVASLISSRDPNHPGVAPGADIISLKALDEGGGGSFNVIENSLKWIIANAAHYHIASVNLSLGDGGNYATATSLHGIGDELAQLNRMGIVVVAAAGNSYGPGDNLPGVAYPAADPNVIAVGAVWDADHGPGWRWETGAIDRTTGPDRIASFSQRGGRGSQEVFAPGTLLLGAAPDGGTSSLSGTSMSSALVAGLVPLVQQLAVEQLGRRLSAGEVRTLIHDSGAIIVDGDDENDNVHHTGLTYRRVDALSLLEAALSEGGYTSGSLPQAVTVTVVKGKDTSGVEMGEIRLGRVRGLVYGDSDFDGRRDAREPLLAGRTVFEDANGNGKLDAGEVRSITDSRGRYSLDNLKLGQAIIRVIPRAGETAPSPVTVPITSALDKGVDFGMLAIDANIDRAPTLTGDGQSFTVAEDAPPSAGVTVAQLLGNTFQTAHPGAREGLAVVGTEGRGRWQFSLDNGRSWTDFGPQSFTSARPLRAQDRVRFVPSRNTTDTGTLHYYAWDRTTGTVARFIDLTGQTGGQGAFSAQPARVTCTVRAANDAPILGGPGVFPHISSTEGSFAAVPVSSLLANRLRDPDSPRVGIAVEAGSGDGQWQYSQDGGRTWLEVGLVPPGKARLLDYSAMVRFAPRTGSKSEASLSYRAWDMTTGTAGSLSDLGPVGGSSAFSQLLARAFVQVSR